MNFIEYSRQQIDQSVFLKQYMDWNFGIEI